jgi:hypothetical protein
MLRRSGAWPLAGCSATWAVEAHNGVEVDDAPLVLGDLGERHPDVLAERSGGESGDVPLARICPSGQQSWYPGADDRESCPAPYQAFDVRRASRAVYGR